MTNVRVLLVVILLAAIVGGGFLLFRTLKKKKGEGSLFLLPNDDGTYRVEERDEKEAYKNGRKERMDATLDAPERPSGTHTPTQTVHVDPDPIYIRTDMNIYETIKEGLDANDPCPEGVSCRPVRFDMNSDLIWYLEKIHQDTKAVTIDYLKAIPEFDEKYGGMKLIRENPLTVGDGTHEVVIGKDLNLLDGYLATLFLYKKLGRPLPKPDTGADYRTFD